MTTTPFYSPHDIQQITIENPVTQRPSISWTGLENLGSNDSFAVTTQPLYTISGLWMEKFLSTTNQLQCTQFNIPDNGRNVVGIEFQLNIQRASRIQDAIIQLTLNGELIGENYANSINPVQSDMYTGDLTAPIPVGNYHIYGGVSDVWNTELSSADVADASFGIVIQFSSNHIYPHKDLAYINQVGIRVTYE